MKTSIISPILVKCTYQGFCSEIKKGNYYLAYPSPCNSTDFILCGIKDLCGWPIIFGNYHFQVV